MTASKRSMSARPPNTTDTGEDEFNRDAFLAGSLPGSGELPWEMPEALRRANDKASRKVVNLHFGYDYGLKLKFLRENGVNVHRFLLGASKRAVDEEIQRLLEAKQDE